MKKKYLIVIAFYICKSLVSQNYYNSDSIMVWNENQKLKWTDFKGKIDTLSTDYSSIIQAVTASTIKIKYKKNEFLILAVFYKYKSWTIDTSDSDILDHEQLHFDICELYARKLRKKISEVDSNDSLYYETINDLIIFISKKLTQRQKLYDKETCNGSFPQRQEKWEKTIKSEMEALEEYNITVK